MEPIIVNTLCLSGGGFRATLFHLGVIREMVNLDFFHRIDHINSVSGGSILAGLVMTELSRRGGFKSLEDFDFRITIPIIKFIQNAPKRKIFGWIPIHRDPKRLQRVLEDLYKEMRFKDIDRRVEWICYATLLNSSELWGFSRSGIGSLNRGIKIPGEEDYISKGVAASACFIPVFKPLKEKERDDVYNYLVDGGVFDNLGIDDILKKKEYLHEDIIISDASSVIEKWCCNKPKGIDLYKRAMDISIGMSNKLRHREIYENIISKGRGVMIEVSKPVEFYIDDMFFMRIANKYGVPKPYFKKVSRKIQKELGEVRTDLNSFHDIEIELLIWSGAAKINATLKKWKPQLFVKDLWGKISDTWTDVYDEGEVLKILRAGDEMTIYESHKKLHCGTPLIEKIKG